MKKRIAILTADKPRHCYYVNRINSKEFNLCGVFIEKKKIHPMRCEGTPCIKKHFEGFEQTEAETFEEDLDVAEELIKRYENINNAAPDIEAAKPDIILVYGTSLIKGRILSVGEHRINMHLGLSPYYRGSGTNFFPFVNREIEYVGVTIHHLSKEIDGGSIIAQARPKISSDDTIHTIGCKTIMEGVRTIIEMLHKIEKGEELLEHKQDLKQGRLYYRKHFNEEECRRAYENVQNGLIKNYEPKQVNIIEL